MRFDNSKMWRIGNRVRVQTIPKGLRPPAQGCEERATLGHRPTRHQPQRGCGNSLFVWRSCDVGHNRWGCNFLPTFSQGSSFLATLGFRAESRWDSQMAQVCGANRVNDSEARMMIRRTMRERAREQSQRDCVLHERSLGRSAVSGVRFQFKPRSNSEKFLSNLEVPVLYRQTQRRRGKGFPPNLCNLVHISSGTN